MPPADLLITHLGKMADGKTEVCILEQFGHAALDIICKVTPELVLCRKWFRTHLDEAFWKWNLT